MKHNDIVSLSHLILKENISKNDVVIDATMGNGHDTLFLAEHAKHVYAFDIQKIALEKTMALLSAHNITNATLFHESHENIVGLIPHFKGVIFNLGYLPDGDHHITTTKETTLNTIAMLLSVLPQNGFILIVLYPGHHEGYEEAMAIDDYFHTLDSKTFSIIQASMPYQKNHPPYILFIKKR